MAVSDITKFKTSDGKGGQKEVDLSGIKLRTTDIKFWPDKQQDERAWLRKGMPFTVVCDTGATRSLVSPGMAHTLKMKVEQPQPG